MYTYLNIHVCVSTHQNAILSILALGMYIHIYIHAYIYIYIYLYIYINIYIYIYIYTYTWMHIYIYIYIHIHIYQNAVLSILALRMFGSWKAILRRLKIHFLCIYIHMHTYLMYACTCIDLPECCVINPHIEDVWKLKRYVYTYIYVYIHIHVYICIYIYTRMLCYQSSHWGCLAAEKLCFVE
jgi:hypothetical protein